jgi:hypothetical protein
MPVPPPVTSAVLLVRLMDAKLLDEGGTREENRREGGRMRDEG